MELSYIRDRILGDPAAFVAECEAAYLEKLRTAAAFVAERAEACPVVLISGPSGSGKTTSAKIIESYLDRWGIETHSVAMDNYFLSLGDRERELLAENKLDLESPDRLDAALLHEHLAAFRACRPVEMPFFDFPTSTRRGSGQILTRKKGELIIFEGIHSLNPSIFGDTDDFTTRVYVSVRTRVGLPSGGELHPSKIRLARRMIRDGRARGRSFSDTVAMFGSVERGEQNHIMPYKHRAHLDLDTFVPYELCVYKSFLPEVMEGQAEWAGELFELLHALPTLDPTLVPKESLLREFIGGGTEE